MVKIRNFVRLIAIKIMYFIYTKIYGMDIAKTARISFGAKLDKTCPRGLHIGDESCIAYGAMVLTHDFVRSIRTETFIGKRTLICSNAIVMPGVRIGDEVVVGAGSVVTRDVPSGCIVAGNPARIIKEGIKTTRFGQIIR